MLRLIYFLHFTGSASIVNFAAEYFKINIHMLISISPLEKSPSWLLRRCFCLLYFCAVYKFLQVNVFPFADHIIIFFCRSDLYCGWLHTQPSPFTGSSELQPCNWRVVNTAFYVGASQSDGCGCP